MSAADHPAVALGCEEDPCYCEHPFEHHVFVPDADGETWRGEYHCIVGSCECVLDSGLYVIGGFRD